MVAMLASDIGTHNVMQVLIRLRGGSHTIELLWNADKLRKSIFVACLSSTRPYRLVIGKRSFALADAEEGQISDLQRQLGNHQLEQIRLRSGDADNYDGFRVTSQHHTQLASPHFALLEQLVYAKNTALQLAKVTDGQLDAVSQLLKVTPPTHSG